MTLDEMIREASPPSEKDEEEDKVEYEADDEDDLTAAISLLLQLRVLLESIMFESKHMIMKKSMKLDVEEAYYDVLSFLTNYDAEEAFKEKDDPKIINVAKEDYTVSDYKGY
jgi:hypothetical protein